MGDAAVDDEDIDLEEGELGSDEEEEDENLEDAQKPQNSVQVDRANLRPPNGHQPKPSLDRASKEPSDSEAGSRSKSDDPQSKKGVKARADRKGEKRHFEDDEDGHRRNKGKRKAVDDDEPRNFEDELQEYEKSTRRLRRGSVESRHSSHSQFDESNRGGMTRGRRGALAQPARNGKRPRRAEEIRPLREKRVPCKFFLEGRCKFSDADCPFSHNVQQQRKLEVCKFYVGGNCQKGQQCVYMHHDFPCKFYHTGQKCYAGEANCKFSHDALTQDARIALDRFMEKENNHNLARRYQEHQMATINGEDVSGVSGGPSRNALLPTPEQENYENRRRPQFFQDTLHSETEGSGDHGSHYENYSADQYEGGYSNAYEQREGQADETLNQSPKEDSASGEPSDITQRMPKPQRDLFMRLQQRALQPTPAADEPQNEEPRSNDSLDESRGQLTIVEPIGDDAPVVSNPVPVHPPVRKSRWNDSDEEDDNVIASSLKKLQEHQPRAPLWNTQAHLANHDADISEDLFSGLLELAEQRMNRGKVLLPPPLIHEAPAYYPPAYGYDPYAGPPPPQQAYYPPLASAPPVIQPHPVQPNYSIPPPNLYPIQPPVPDPHSQWPPYEAARVQPEYPPTAYPPPNYPPPLLSTLVSTIDPRLQRVNPEYMAPYQPPGSEYSALRDAAIPPALESVIQKLAIATQPIPARPPVDTAPEIECSLEKNQSPPLYRLEILTIAKPDVRAAYRKVKDLRSEEELLKDPRIAKFVQAAAKASPPPVPVAASPAAPNPTKSASAVEFDAFTAMIQEALGQAKKKEEKISPPGAKRLKKPDSHSPVRFGQEPVAPN